MKRKTTIVNRLMRTLPLMLLMILCGSIQARSQEITVTREPDSAAVSPATQNAGECAQLLDKTLDALEKCRAAAADKDAQIVTANSLIVKVELHNEELLKAVALLTSGEKRDKSFFGKLREQLGAVLKTATDPKTITTIVSIILIVDRLKR